MASTIGLLPKLSFTLPTPFSRHQFAACVSSAAIAQCRAVLLSASFLNTISLFLRCWESGMQRVHNLLSSGLPLRSVLISIKGRTASSGTMLLFLVSSSRGSMMSVPYSPFGPSTTAGSSSISFPYSSSAFSTSIPFSFSFSSNPTPKSSMLILLLFKNITQSELSCHSAQYINTMRKDEIQLLDSIDKLTVNQFYLLEQPKTPQQTFLHLYGHRQLVERAMFHLNLDRLRTQLEGSFAHSSLNIALVTSYIDNQIDFTEEEEWLVDIVHNWVNFYPTIRSTRREKYLVCGLVLQDVLDLRTVKGFSHFLAYLNIISVDVWKIIRNKKNEQDFVAQRPVKEEIKEMMMDRVGERLDAADLLDFVSGCIPKTLLNILLSNESLPVQVKKKVKQLECLYANQSVQYFLKKHVKLALLLKQILMMLLTMEMQSSLLQRLMLLAMRYYCVYHFDKKYSAPEIVIHCYNRLTDQLRRSLNDEFTLFFKIIQKLGKNKFIDFVANNSPFAKRIIDIVRKKPTIAYPQDGANPYNTFGVAEEISIERGATAFRYFQILQDFSIFYFRIDVPYYDITVRLYYLGEIASSKTARTLLFTHEKTQGELKNSVNAMKKGLYMFEFDNSYSWLNSKKVYYQNQVFTPLELKVTNADEWIDQFYGNVYLNQIASDEDILVVEYRKPQERQPALEGIFLEKEGGVLRLRMGKGGSEYVYETDNVERMLQRAEEYFHAKEKYSWHVNQQPVSDIAQIDNFLRGAPAPAATKEQQPPSAKKEQISLAEYKQDQQSQNQPEYEVIQRSQLQRSQILNESPAPKPSSQPQPKQQKEVISCTFQQTSQIYES